MADEPLRTPAERRDTITRQMQREILGSATPDEVTSPESSNKAKSSPKTQAAPSTPPSARRRTLSPSKAALLVSQSQNAEDLDAAVSRRDTVSPTALRSLLEAEGGLDASIRSSSSLENQSEALQSPRVARTSLSSSKRPLSAKKSVDEDGNKSLNTTDSFTDSMFAPNLLEQDAMRRSSTLDPAEAESVVAALQKEARALSSSSLEIEETEEKASTPPKQVSASKKAASALKKAASATERTSPAQKKPSPAKRASPSPKKTSPARDKSPPAAAKRASPARSKSPAKQPLRAASPDKSKSRTSPGKSSTTRRATVDPSDVLTMLDDSSIVQEDRRQTIDESGLLELHSALESPGGSKKDSARKRREEASRKRAHDVNVQPHSAEKRPRVSLLDSGDNNQDTHGSEMDVDSDAEKPSTGLPEEGDNNDAGKPSALSPKGKKPSQIPKPSLFSPPPGGSRVRTPLKGILSARKATRDAESGVQTTPNKTVNFGPSQGAEFNHGSPSTSMTPMCAKDAVRLYPSEPRASSEEEPDDAETSLNSSILDEADSFDAEESKENNERLELPTQIPVFNPRRSSLLASKPTDKSRRRHSLRGYSPLDSQAEARRRRRRTISAARPNSSVSTATSFTAKDKAPGTASSQSPPPKPTNSFLMPTARTPYADSSASSDAGEDMEITGDYTNQFTLTGRDSIGVTGKSRTSFARDDDTTEFNTAEFSLGHLLAESAVYELTKSAPEPELPGSLGDLANEVADIPSRSRGQFEDSSQRVSQDTTLDPIQEEDEGAGASRQSMMSLESMDDSDVEARRESLAMNLSSQFDQVSTSGSQGSPFKADVRLITMEELLSSADLDQDVELEAENAFVAAGNDSSVEEKDVQLTCAYDTCLEVLERHCQDVSTWSSGLTDELASLLHLKAPALFNPDNLDEAGHKAIRELFGTETLIARSGWCQLRAQMEKQLVGNLSSAASSLANDVKTLKAIVSSDREQRDHELAELKEMIAREEQMGVLFDAIEEQQGAQNEYEHAVKDLEGQCSSLLLEESVLQSRLNVLEGRAAELEPVTSAASTRLEQEVLATEELLTIQDSLSMWKVREATSSLLRLSSCLEDVLFNVEISVDVHLGSAGRASTSIKATETLKRRKRNTYLPIEGDVVLMLQRLLLDPHHISRIVDESDLLENPNDGHVCSKLQILESFIARSFRLLRELRDLSTHFSMRYDEDDSTLWIDFLRFPREDVGSVRFCVGFPMVPIFPYTDFQTVVKVVHGQVSTEVLTKEIELVPREAPKYFTRVCRRLHESFVR